MLQSKLQSEQQPQTTVETPRTQPLTSPSIIFCGQVLTFQYFGQIKPYRPARKLFKTEILQNRSIFFFDPDSLLHPPHP